MHVGQSMFAVKSALAKTRISPISTIGKLIKTDRLSTKWILMRSLSNSPESFPRRHIGPSPHQLEKMLSTLGYKSIDELISHAVPSAVRSSRPLSIEGSYSEPELLARARQLGQLNQVKKSLIGLGYYNTHTPTVILRNVLENPGWYTQYTPYQAEISQGRLESLMNFQTLVTEMTGMDVANASLLDEGTAAAEAMMMCHAQSRSKKVFWVDQGVFEHTRACLQSRADGYGLQLQTGDFRTFNFDSIKKDLCGVLVQVRLL